MSTYYLIVITLFMFMINISLGCII